MGAFFPSRFSGRIGLSVLTAAAIAMSAALPAQARGPENIAHVAGHINEGIDLWAKDRALPRLVEGDLIAFHPAGAYGSSMASDHCLRGQCAEVMVGSAPEAQSG